ncbi:hypothetical protein K413DRAFT_4698 [Clostridium sp. ASBs410]|nr:hypothetical protein K413DRAFT_4698 [Clostridium sp. ASBs410]
MKTVRCISEREAMPGQLEVGSYYWLDETSKYIDYDGDEYAMVYYDEDKQHKVGNMRCDHFCIPLSVR